MAKQSSLFECTNCGYESSKWLGQCPSCKEWSTMEEVEDLPKELELNQYVKVAKLTDIKPQMNTRISTNMNEFDRVLGGGIVPAEVVLLSGEPGVGKSTLLLQLVANIVETKKRAVYVSAEESAEQVALRAQRIIKKGQEDLTLISAFEVEAILKSIKELKPDLIVVDSVQTVFSQKSRGLPGSVSQIKAVSTELVAFAKEKGIATVIVGHITKQGNIAGPKLLEHLVDCVLQLEGDEKHGFRILRSFKNRYGSTDEVGIFEMASDGMQEVADPSLYFLEDAAQAQVGVCPAVIMEGNRPLIMEVQALTSSTPFSLPKRVAEGISKTKLEVLTAIIGKYGRIDLSTKDIYINIAGGFKVKDPALDLAIVLAILSSLKDKKLPKGLVAYGEVALTGRIRKVVRAETRKSEIERLGYQSFDEVYKGVEDIKNLVLKFK